jgi:type IV secretory pathway VirB3-like protein
MLVTLIVYLIVLAIVWFIARMIGGSAAPAMNGVSIIDAVFLLLLLLVVVLWLTHGLPPLSA